MRIGKKLLIGFIPLAVLTGLVAEVLYINSKRIQDSSQKVKEIYQNYSLILTMRKLEKEFLFYREKYYLTQLTETCSRLAESLDSQRKQMSNEGEIPEGWPRAQEFLQKYEQSLNQLLAADKGLKAEEALVQLAITGQQLERIAEEMIHRAWMPIQSATQKAETYSTVFAVWAILVGVVLAFFLTKLLVLPIQKLVQGTKKVAEGDFSQRVQARSRDEIGELAESFNRMVDSLEQGQTRLQQQSQELRKTKETLENIVQSSVDAIVATDPKGRITFANRSMQGMLLGQTGQEEELLGVPMAQLYSAGLGEARKIMAILREQGRLQNYETTMMRNGRVIPILTSASLLKDEQGSVVGTLGIIKDLTEKKRLEEELRKAQTNLAQQEKLAAIGRLASGVAHEMNDPLSSILTFSNLLREETSAEDSTRESLDIIIKEATRARNIVRDLLSFSREFKPALQWIDLNDALNVGLLLLEKQGALEKVEIQINLAKELPLVRADAGQIQQVFMNILLNSIQAMEFTPQSLADDGLLRERKLVLRTEFFPTLEEPLVPQPSLTGLFIRVTIQDNGRGIRPENLNKIFDPFFTTKPTGEGTGLGLFIVSGILKNYGAQYQIESDEEQGTIFTIDFPLSGSEK